MRIWFSKEFTCCPSQDGCSVTAVVQSAPLHLLRVHNFVFFCCASLKTFDFKNLQCFFPRLRSLHLRVHSQSGASVVEWPLVLQVATFDGLKNHGDAKRFHGLIFSNVCFRVYFYIYDIMICNYSEAGISGHSRATLFFS